MSAVLRATVSSLSSCTKLVAPPNGAQCFSLHSPPLTQPLVLRPHLTRSIVCTAASNDAQPSSKKHASLRSEAEQSNQEVYDRLIDVFLTRTTEEWRKLIAYSSQWPTLAEGVFKRMEERAKDMEPKDDEEARKLRKALRRLQTVHEELEEYRNLVSKFRDTPSREWESLVALHRNSLGGDFFGYIELRVRAATSAAAAQGSETSKEAEALAALGTQLVALVEAHDRVLADEVALDSAADRFADLLQSETMEAAEAKLDELAATGKLDPALLLTMARAYAGVKETDITQEEVKDIMAHLYFKAKESFAQQAPAEARILKFLLAVESPSERLSLMEQAFQPGPAMSTSNEDFIHTTPEALLNTIENVLAVYDGASSGLPVGPGAGGMAGQAAALMNPEVIVRMRELQTAIRKSYL